jgi:hypothetical protein
VADVLDQVADGMAWESIIEEWNGRVTKEAIAEAVLLASGSGVSRQGKHWPSRGLECARQDAAGRWKSDRN